MSSRSGVGEILVSIVIPTRNRPETLVRAVESACGQTYGHVEIVVVNDGGLDVGDLVAEAAGARPVRYISFSKNRGQAAARNAGIRAAQGEYVAFLDDDDEYFPDHVTVLVDATRERPFGAVYSDARRVVLEEGTGREIGNDVPFSEDFDELRLRICNYIPLITVLAERDFVESVGGFDESLDILEDWELLIRMAARTDFRHVAVPTCEFRVRPGDRSHVNANLGKQLRGFRYVYDKHPSGSPSVMRGRIEMLNRLKQEAERGLSQNGAPHCSAVPD